jgi:hypothetical protein
MFAGVSRTRRKVSHDPGPHCRRDLMHLLGNGAENGAKLRVDRRRLAAQHFRGGFRKTFLHVSHRICRRRCAVTVGSAMRCRDPARRTNKLAQGNYLSGGEPVRNVSGEVTPSCRRALAQRRVKICASASSSPAP